LGKVTLKSNALQYCVALVTIFLFIFFRKVMYYVTFALLF